MLHFQGQEEISKNVTLPYFNPKSFMTLQTCFQEGPRHCTASKFQTSHVFIKGIEWK